MTVTLAQLAALRDIIRNGGTAVRVQGRVTSEWTWNVGGRARSGPVDRLYRGGYLKSVDSNTLELTKKGQRVVEARRGCDPEVWT